MWKKAEGEVTVTAQLSFLEIAKARVKNDLEGRSLSLSFEVAAAALLRA